MTQSSGPVLPESLDALCQRLPPPKPNSVDVPTKPGPLVLVRDPDETLGDFISTHSLGLPVQVAAEGEELAESLIDTLLDSGQTMDAINVLLCALPPRESLWVATRFTWDMYLELERADMTASPKPAATAAESEATPPTPELDTAKIDQALSDAKASVYESMAPVFAAMQQAMASPEMVRAQGDPAIMDASRDYTDKFNMFVADAESPSGPRVLPMPPAGAGRVDRPPMPGKLKLPQAMLEGMRSRVVQQQVQALACTLQWIIAPNLEHAQIGGTVAKSIQQGGTAKAMASATFWSGENINLNLKGAAVPPAPALRTKGVRALLTKAMALKGGILTKADRLNWCLHLALDTASGEGCWEHSLELFKMWHHWCMDERPTIDTEQEH